MNEDFSSVAHLIYDSPDGASIRMLTPEQVNYIWGSRLLPAVTANPDDLEGWTTPEELFYAIFAGEIQVWAAGMRRGWIDLFMLTKLTDEESPRLIVIGIWGRGMRKYGDKLRLALEHFGAVNRVSRCEVMVKRQGMMRMLEQLGFVYYASVYHYTPGQEHVH